MSTIRHQTTNRASHAPLRVALYVRTARLERADDEADQRHQEATSPCTPPRLHPDPEPTYVDNDATTRASTSRPTPPPDTAAPSPSTAGTT